MDIIISHYTEGQPYSCSIITQSVNKTPKAISLGKASQQAPGEAGQLIMLPGLSAKRRKVDRQSEKCMCGRVGNKKGEERGQTMEQWKSQRRKH